MGKFNITRSEAIPFREEDGSIMQMKQYEVSVTVQQEEGETLADIEEQLDLVFNRNLEKTLVNDPIYQKQRKQLNFFLQKIKELLPAKAREIVKEARKITS